MNLRPHLALAALALASCRTSPAVERTPQEGFRHAPRFDASLVDRSVAPCDDFFRFACGGWLARNDIPPDRARWGRFDELRERNLETEREIAEADAAGRIDPQDRYPRKVGDLYAACMDEAGIEARGLEDLRAQWARIEAVRDPATLAAELARLHRGGVSALFDFGANQDFKDATQVIGFVAQGGLTLPDRDYYVKDDERTKAIRAAYAAHLRTMLRLAGVAPSDAERRAADVERMERALAESSWTRVEMRDPAKIYHRVDLAGLERLAPRFPWTGYLADLGRGDVTAIAVTTPRFVERVNQLLASEPPAAWRSYLEWRLLAAMARDRAVPRALVDERFAFFSKTFTGAKQLTARWKHCVETTDRLVGEAIGQAWVRRHFGAEGKERTTRLVAEVERAMGDDLRGLAWMDDATRARALEKLGAVFNKVGYPDAWRNYDALEVDRASFLRSVLAANAFEVHRDLDKIGKPVDRKEWQMTPPTVNAYYRAQLNEMVFPAGILQPPFWSPQAPDAVNYGGIGMVVGHELTHGFDDQGRKFDGRGNLADWWTPAVARAFEERAQCLVRQYAGYTVDGDTHLDGELTLGENIADLGGVKLALAARRAAAAGRPEERVAGFTPDQQFFLGVAQVWCSKTRPEEQRLRAVTDPHSPPRFRVNGTLANTPEFAAAFQCPSGSRMARPPEERCTVW